MGSWPTPDPEGTIHFWFDFASTYSYLAAMTIEARASSAGIHVQWHPILLGPIFAAQGWDDSPFNIYPVKGRYMWRDLERLCAAENLPFTRPAVFPQRGVDAAKIAYFGLEEGWGPDFIRAVFTEHFAHGHDITEHETLERALGAAVDRHPRPKIEAILSQPSRLRTETAMAQDLGVFGAPTFTVGAELFWGFDRMDQAIAWATETKS